MNEATIAQTIVTASLLLIFAGFFIWGWKSGQFKNIEEAKYIIFRRRGEADETSRESPAVKGEDK